MLQQARRCASGTSRRHYGITTSNKLIEISPQTYRTPNPIPAAFIRGGTSKGIFLNRKHLPEDVAEWDPIFRGLMGSPDPNGRQLNGMGGGISSLSKICVVGLP